MSDHTLIKLLSDGWSWRSYGSGSSVYRGILDRSIIELNDSTINHLGSYAFKGCNKLVNAKLSALTTGDTYCFSGCEVLENVILPKIQSVAPYSFYDCPALKVLDFGAADSIASNASDSSLLEAVILRKADGICQLVGDTTPFTNVKVTIYVPSMVKDVYLGDVNWSKVADQVIFETIEGSDYEANTSSELGVAILDKMVLA